MVKTMRKVCKPLLPSTLSRKRSTRLSTSRKSASGFSPVDAKSTVDDEGDDGDESKDFPIFDYVLGQKQTSNIDEELTAEQSRSVLKAKADGGVDEQEYEDAVHDAVEGEKGANEDGAERSNASEKEKGEDFRELCEVEQSTQADTDNRDGTEEGGEMDKHNSSGIESTTIDAPESSATKRSAKGRGKRGYFWEDPQDTERLLELLKQFAMREHYINTKNGGWKNNAFGEIGKHMGKGAKHCSNKYMRLKHKYLDIVELLGLRVGLQWDAENHKILGHPTAWSKVKDPKLKKLEDQTFLYKEQFDILNSVLKFAPSLKVKKPKETVIVVGSSSEVQGSDAESPSTAVEIHGDDQDYHDADEISDAGNEAPTDSEAGSSSVASSNAAVTVRPSTSTRHSGRNWFGAASTAELVQLLVKYAEEDYINPVTKNWQNDVFREISGKIGKTQSQCSSKYLSLKDKYADMQRLLRLNMGFRLNDEKNEVVGSNGAWARVEDPDLLRCRRSKFLFWEEFGKLAEKLSFVRSPYESRKIGKRSRSTRRILGTSRPSYVDASSDEVESHDAHDENNAETAGSHESDEEPPRKKRFLSHTYEQRGEASYLATFNMSAQREELKAIVDAQLSIQREHVAIHKAQITALHRQLETEYQLSRSLQRCRIRDEQRQVDLEDWRVLAQEKLQHETFLTSRGKVRIMQTLQNLTSRTDGYLGVVSLERTLRKLWCKIELEKEVYAKLSDYFIMNEDEAVCEDEAENKCQNVADDSTLVELESEDQGVPSMRGPSESRDFDVQETLNRYFDTRECSSERNSNERHHGDRNVSEEENQAGDEEVVGSPHVPADKANDHQVPKNTEGQVDEDQESPTKEIEINPYMPIDDDQGSEANEDSDVVAQSSQDEEGLNKAFLEIESEFVTDLARHETGRESHHAEALSKDTF